MRTESFSRQHSHKHLKRIVHFAERSRELRIRAASRMLLESVERALELSHLFAEVFRISGCGAFGHSHPNNCLAALNQLRRIRPDPGEVFARQCLMLERMKHVMKVIILPDA